MTRERRGNTHEEGVSVKNSQEHSKGGDLGEIWEDSSSKSRY